MADTLSSLSIVAYILAGVFFVCAIILFIILRIPEVIDYFTNKSAKKSVKKMVSSDGRPAKNASFQTSPTNRERGKLTERVTVPEPRKIPPAAKVGMPTNSAETSLLKEGGTAILDPTEELPVELAGATELLDQNGTVVLQETVNNVAAQRPHIMLTKREEVVYTHTDEVIP